MKSCFFCLFLMTISILTGYTQQLDSLLQTYNSSEAGSQRILALQNLFDFHVNNDPVQAKAFALEQMDHAQSLSDTLGLGRASYNIAVLLNNENVYDSAAYWYKLALEYFKNAGDLKKITDANFGLAILAYYKGNFDAALDLIDENIQLLKSSQTETKKEGAELQLMGLIHMRKGNYNIALDVTLQAVSIFKASKDTLRLADAFNTLGGIEGSLGNYRESIAYNKEALAIYEAHNDKIFQAQALNDIGNMHFSLKQFADATSYLLRSAELAGEMGFVDVHATALTNLGKVYVAQGGYEQALENLVKALTMAEQTNNPIKKIEAYHALGTCYSALQDAEIALSYFDLAIALSEEIGSLEGLSDALHGRSIAYEHNNELGEALRDFKAYKAVRDSLFDQAKSKQIEELRTHFELEAKESEIQLQRTNIKLLEQKAEIARLQHVLFGAALVFLVLVIAIGGYLLRSKNRQSELARRSLDVALHGKSRQLTTQALHITRKNEILDSLKQLALRAKRTANAPELLDIIQKVNADMTDDKGWDAFVKNFEDVHPEFFRRLANLYPSLSPNDYRLLALIKMNFSSKEMAGFLKITLPGIKKARQRIRKKMGLHTKDSLEAVIFSI